MIPCKVCAYPDTDLWLDDLSYSYEFDGSPCIWRFQLRECSRCGVGFVTPSPALEVLKSFYSASYHVRRQTISHEISSATRVKFRLARWRYARRPASGMIGIGIWFAGKAAALAIESALGRTIPYSAGVPLQYARDAHILDIGYGRGAWLAHMAGYGYRNLYGYEPMPNSHDSGILKSIGIRTFAGALDDVVAPARGFDCIRFEHVVEHLTDPLSVLRTCRELLHPDGVLVLNVPNRASWSRAISTRHWAALDLPGHVFHYTPQSIEMLLRRAGFKHIAVRSYAALAVLAGTVSNWLTEKWGFRAPRWSLLGLAPIYTLICRVTSRGDAIMALAQRSGLSRGDT